MRLRGESMTTALDKLGDGIVISDATARSTFLNAAAKQLLGTEVLDAPFSEHSRAYGIFHPDKETYVSTEELPLVRAVDGHDTDDMPLFIRNEDNPDGMVIMARGRSLESTVTGRVVAGMAVLQRAADHSGTRTGLDDIVSNLRRKNEMLESICDNISDGIIVADAAGQILFVNSTTLKIFGEWFAEPAVADWSATYGIFYPDIKTPVPTEQLPLVRALQGEETGEMELFIRNESNREGTYIIGRASPIFNGDRTAVVAAMCTFRDITREKEAENRLESTDSDLRSQTQLLETVFNSMSEGIVVADATGKFLYVNPSAQQIVGMGPVDEPPEEWAQVYGTYYPDRETPVKSEDLPLQRAILKGESVDEEDVFIRNQNRPDGIYIRVSARPLLHDVAGVRGGVIIFHDVTEQVNAQEALARAFAQGRLEIVETILHNIGNAINSVTIGIETVRHTLASDPPRATSPRPRRCPQGPSGRLDRLHLHGSTGPEGPAVRHRHRGRFHQAERSVGEDRRTGRTPGESHRGYRPHPEGDRRSQHELERHQPGGCAHGGRQGLTGFAQSKRGPDRDRLRRRAQGDPGSRRVRFTR